MPTPGVTPADIDRLLALGATVGPPARAGAGGILIAPGSVPAVIGAARAGGWHAAHFRPGLTRSGEWRTAVQADGKGFVDLVLCRDRVLFIELKAEAGRVSAAQAIWLDRLRAAGAEVYLWKPSMWPEINRVLA